MWKLGPPTPPLCCRGCVGAVLPREFPVTAGAGTWKAARRAELRSPGWERSQVPRLGPGAGAILHCSLPWAPRSPPASPGSEPAQPRTPGAPNGSTSARCRDPQGNVSQKHAPVSIGTPTVSRQTRVCWLFTYSLHRQACVCVYLFTRIFWRANQQGKHESTKKRHGVVCVWIAVLHRQISQGSETEQVSIYKTYVVAALAMYIHVA